MDIKPESFDEKEQKRTKQQKAILSVGKYVLAMLIGVVLTLCFTGTSLKQIYIDKLVKTYYDGEINKEKIEESKIAASIDALSDTHSYYIPEEIGIELFNRTITGEYGGIGVEIISDNNKYVVNEVFKNTPAEKAGVRVNDEIVEIEKQAVKDLDFSKIGELIRGEIGTEVLITFKRDGKTLDISVKREKIETPTVYAEKTDDGIGYIKIEQFDADTDKEFKKAIDGLDKIEGLVVDLRDNPGGLLMVCLRSLDLFLEKDTPLVIARYKNFENVYKAENDCEYEIPLVVLINGNSASSSEIFAACMKSNGRAKIIGEKSYGKGSIQRTFEFSGNTGLNLTVGHFYSPDDKIIDKKGVEPDIVVTNEKGKDMQLQEAIKQLKK